MREGTDKTHTLDRRSARRHHQLPARHPAFRDFDRAGARRHDRRRAWSTIRSTTSCSPPSAARAPSSTTSGCGSRPARGSPTRWSPAACRTPAAAILELDRARSTPPPRSKVAGLRRFGAAALDLAWVAAGRFDAYWERNLSPWDMAAGMHPGARGRRLRHRSRRTATRMLASGRYRSPATRAFTGNCCALLKEAGRD